MTSTPSSGASTADLRQWMRAVAIRRDEASFARLFDHFAPRLISFFMRAGMSRDAAEEVAQDAMILVWNKASLYEPDKSAVSTWVFTIARNCRIDRARREARRSKSETAALEEPGVVDSSEDVLLADERDSAVREAMAGLPPDQLAVVRLSFFSDKPHSEIARELGIPLGTVKSRLRLAMAKIRTVWETIS